MFHMINRMRWNSAGWKQPTLLRGDGGYPGKLGFGIEDWNFQLDDAVDGFVYGYLCYAPPEWRVKEAGNEFRIGFWSRDPETRKKMFVGYYDGASVPTEEDYERVDRAFTERGIYTRRINEVISVVDKLDYERIYQEITYAVREHWLTFKCPVSRVHCLVEYLPLEMVVPSKNIGWRFTNPTFVDGFKFP
jgi:hypothetical protein